MHLLDRLLRRQAARRAGIDPKVLDAAVWMEQIRREQLGPDGGEVLSAMVIVETRRSPEADNTTVMFSTDRENGYTSSVQVAGMLAQAKHAADMSAHAALLQSGLNQLGAGLAKGIREGIDKGVAKAAEQPPVEGVGPGPGRDHMS